MSVHSKYLLYEISCSIVHPGEGFTTIYQQNNEKTRPMGKHNICVNTRNEYHCAAIKK